MLRTIMEWEMVMPTRRSTLAGLGAAAVMPATGAARPPADPVGPSTRFAFEAIVDIASSEELGAGPLGGRRIVPILGGTFEGPRLKGKVRPGGADRQLIRGDGIRQLHALYEIETDDGAVLTISNRVLIDDPGNRPRYAFSQIEITAPSGRYDWLNRRVFVGTLNSLRPQRQAVRVSVFELV
jgi:hypothetical protein